MNAQVPYCSEQQDRLAASFNALKQNARYAADLREWITQHPELFLGKAVLPENPEVTVGLTVAHSNIMNTEKNKGLIVEVSLTVKSPFSHNPLLPQLTVCGSSSTSVNYQYKNLLKLSLMEWPYAAATVAGTYLESDSTNHQLMHKHVLEDYIDIALTHHFPGFSLDMLRDWVEAGFIAKTDHGNVLARHIQDVLYKAMEKQTSAALPDVLAP